MPGQLEICNCTPNCRKSLTAKTIRLHHNRARINPTPTAQASRTAARTSRQVAPTLPHAVLLANDDTADMNQDHDDPLGDDDQHSSGPDRRAHMEDWVSSSDEEGDDSSDEELSEDGTDSDESLNESQAIEGPDFLELDGEDVEALLQASLGEDWQRELYANRMTSFSVLILSCITNITPH